MVPLTWIEHVASPLPRECSTTELQGQLVCAKNRASKTGAGEGNRTLVISLEGFSSTIELHPQRPPLQPLISKFNSLPVVERAGFEPAYSERTDLQSVAFNHSATSPQGTPNYGDVRPNCQHLFENLFLYQVSNQVLIALKHMILFIFTTRY